ncbi:MAG: ABC transporter ATP-binding protein [Firmicutes bacterium]|nr:ABC transporter ATP-binding protein [Bacillota bacterium]
MIYEIEGLTFSYPGTDRRVLDQAELTLREGQILCILGPNGAGKTTLLNCMAGLLRPQSGQIRLCGEPLEQMKEKDIARLVGYVPQLHTPAFDYRVLDFVLMGRSPQMGVFGRPKAADEAASLAVLESMGIGHLAEKSYRNISGGERQQVLIARAIVQQPKAVLFDEPTAHLDYGNQHRVLMRIRQMAAEGFSVIITTHNPDHALLLADQAAIVSRDGRIIQGDSRQIITEENLREIYGIDLYLTWIEKLGRRACLVPGLEGAESWSQ